jgi:hypothetical protein
MGHAFLLKRGRICSIEVQRYIRSNLDKNTSTHFTKTASYTNFNSLRFKVTTDETRKIQEKLEGNNTAFSNTITR